MTTINVIQNNDLAVSKTGSQENIKDAKILDRRGEERGGQLIIDNRYSQHCDQLDFF
jgi:hypothetical protein